MFCSTVTAADTVETTEMGSGKIRDEGVRKLAPESGFIADAESWEKVWTAWRPGEVVPKVDFREELILVGTVPGPNLVILNPKMESGDVNFVVGGTKIGGPGFGYRFVKIPKAGVKTVNGKPIDDASGTEESITVKIVGTLRTGIAAIGGETTGTTITAKGITWELDFAGNPRLAQAAEKWAAKKVMVEGRLERREGVEIKERWIVTVTAMSLAADQNGGATGTCDHAAVGGQVHEPGGGHTANQDGCGPFDNGARRSHAHGHIAQTGRGHGSDQYRRQTHGNRPTHVGNQAGDHRTNVQITNSGGGKHGKVTPRAV
jgi:hypothetical protein